MPRAIGFLILALMLLGLMWSALPRCNPTGELHIETTAVTAENLALAERLLRMRLPAEAEPLGFAYAHWQSTLLALKVRVPADRVDALLKASPFAKAKWLKTLPLDLTIAYYPWWDVSTASLLRAAEVQVAEDHIAVAVCSDRPGAVVLYFHLGSD